MQVDQPIEVLGEQEVDQPLVQVEQQDLEPRLGFKPMEEDFTPKGPIEEPRWTGGQRATPVEELENVPMDPALLEIDVIIDTKIPSEMRTQVI